MQRKARIGSRSLISLVANSHAPVNFPRLKRPTTASIKTANCKSAALWGQRESSTGEGTACKSKHQDAASSIKNSRRTLREVPSPAQARNNAEGATQKVAQAPMILSSKISACHEIQTEISNMIPDTIPWTPGSQSGLARCKGRAIMPVIKDINKASGMQVACINST